MYYSLTFPLKQTWKFPCLEGTWKFVHAYMTNLMENHKWGEKYSPLCICLCICLFTTDFQMVSF